MPLLALLSASPAWAQASDQAEIAFILMFGNDVRAAQATETTQDDGALAHRILAAAESGRNAPDLTIRLYEKAYDFGLKDPIGFPPALQALDKLMEVAPDRKPLWNEHRLTLLEKWYDHGGAEAVDPEEIIDLYMRLADRAIKSLDADQAESFYRRGDDFARKARSPRRDEIRDSLGELTKLRKVLERIEAAKARLETDPAAADELAMLYLVELDSPKLALQYAPQMQDAALKQQVSDAALDFADAGMGNTIDNARFYAGLGKEDKAPNRVAMLVRAMVWYTEYLSREPTSRETITEATGALEAISDELANEGIGRKLARKMASKIRGGGLFDRPDDVAKAIDAAVAWLYTQMDEEKYWEEQPETSHHWGGYTALVVYALLMADEDPRTNRDLYRATNWMMNAQMGGTYAICFRIHAWEVLPQRERFRNIMARDVGRLRQGMNRVGFWDYQIASRDRSDTKLDVSTTLAGGLGIWIGEESGGMTPPGGQWDKIALGLIENQNADGGWTYNPVAGGASFGSMTSAGVALLYAARPHVSERNREALDEAINKGIEWLDINFSPTTNVNRGNWKNYYLAAVQHVGIFSNRKEFKGMDWYESAAEHLVKSQQANGSWGSVTETAFAVAFLCRGGIQFDFSSLEENAEDATEAPEAEAAPAQE